MGKLATRWYVDTLKTNGSNLLKTIRLADMKRILQEAKASGMETANHTKEALILDDRLKSPFFDIDTIEKITIERVNR